MFTGKVLILAIILLTGCVAQEQRSVHYFDSLPLELKEQLADEMCLEFQTDAIRYGMPLDKFDAVCKCLADGFFGTMPAGVSNLMQTISPEEQSLANTTFALGAFCRETYMPPVGINTFVERCTNELLISNTLKPAINGVCSCVSRGVYGLMPQGKTIQILGKDYAAKMAKNPAWMGTKFGKYCEKTLFLDELDWSNNLLWLYEQQGKPSLVAVALKNIY